ncbi:FAD-binding oxidoreductase [Amaricoccus sp. W119]|uniref:FAD-binding oxidoreductase n=1 Tax=Amaricoccus sp. W119 TaxID=3391833 RepID=UPI0039A45D13
MPMRLGTISIGEEPALQTGGAPIFDREEVSRRVAEALPRFRAALGREEAVTTAAAVREHHARGEGIPDRALPDAVLFPRANAEVAAVAAICHEAGIPIIAFGAGTSLEGHVAAIHGGISLDLSGLNRILDVSEASLDCRVEAGVTREDLNTHLRASGLFFPIDPGANASLGGMAATRASGTAAVRYGTMRESVMGLTVVTADGRIVRTGSRARKSATGYDLTRLFVGSEGTLGVITELQLRLQGRPEAERAAVCQFPRVEDALGLTVAILQMGLPIARIELLNAMQMRMSIRHSDLGELAETPTLFMEFQGPPGAVAEQIEIVAGLCAEHSGGEMRWAETREDRARLWKARHTAYYASLHYLPNRNVMSTDACVPISELAACILETEADVTETGLIAALTGHVGDGNFHLAILFDPDSAEERSRAEALALRTGERALRLGGTCSGEHGVGLHKLDLAARENGEALDLMWSIKRALDPRGIMNPGKLLKPRS